MASHRLDLPFTFTSAAARIPDDVPPIRGAETYADSVPPPSVPSSVPPPSDTVIPPSDTSSVTLLSDPSSVTLPSGTSSVTSPSDTSSVTSPSDTSSVTSPSDTSSITLPSERVGLLGSSDVIHSLLWLKRERQRIVIRNLISDCNDQMTAAAFDQDYAKVLKLANRKYQLCAAEHGEEATEDSRDRQHEAGLALFERGRAQVLLCDWKGAYLSFHRCMRLSPSNSVSVRLAKEALLTPAMLAVALEMANSLSGASSSAECVSVFVSPTRRATVAQSPGTEKLPSDEDEVLLARLKGIVQSSLVLDNHPKAEQKSLHARLDHQSRREKHGVLLMSCLPRKSENSPPPTLPGTKKKKRKHKKKSTDKKLETKKKSEDKKLETKKKSDDKNHESKKKSTDKKLESKKKSTDKKLETKKKSDDKKLETKKKSDDKNHESKKKSTDKKLESKKKFTDKKLESKRQKDCKEHPAKEAKDKKAPVKGMISKQMPANLRLPGDKDVQLHQSTVKVAAGVLAKEIISVASKSVALGESKRQAKKLASLKDSQSEASFAPSFAKSPTGLPAVEFRGRRFRQRPRRGPPLNTGLAPPPYVRPRPHPNTVAPFSSSDSSASLPLSSTPPHSFTGRETSHQKSQPRSRPPVQNLRLTKSPSQTVSNPRHPPRLAQPPPCKKAPLCPQPRLPQVHSAVETKVPLHRAANYAAAVKGLVLPFSPPTSSPPLALPLSQSASKTTVPQPKPHPVPQPVSQPVSQPVLQPVLQPVSQPFSQPVSQPVPQPVSQPVPQPVHQPVAASLTPVPSFDRRPIIASPPISGLPLHVVLPSAHPYQDSGSATVTPSLSADRKSPSQTQSQGPPLADERLSSEGFAHQQHQHEMMAAHWAQLAKIRDYNAACYFFSMMQGGYLPQSPPATPFGAASVPPFGAASVPYFGAAYVPSFGAASGAPSFLTLGSPSFAAGSPPPGWGGLPWAGFETTHPWMSSWGAHPGAEVVAPVKTEEKPSTPETPFKTWSEFSDAFLSSGEDLGTYLSAVNASSAHEVLSDWQMSDLLLVDESLLMRQGVSLLLSRRIIGSLRKLSRPFSKKFSEAKGDLAAYLTLVNADSPKTNALAGLTSHNVTLADLPFLTSADLEVFGISVPVLWGRILGNLFEQPVS